MVQVFVPMLTELPVVLGPCSVYLEKTASDPCSQSPTDPYSVVCALANGCSRGIFKLKAQWMIIVSVPKAQGSLPVHSCAFC